MASPAGVQGGTADAKGMPDVLPSPLDSVGDMRAAAKWMLAAAGAVGAALISGGPLVAAGQIQAVLHAVLAGLGLAIAMGGVGTAMWFTSKVLVPRLMTPAVLRNAGRPRAAPPGRSVLRVRLPAILRPTRHRELVALKELVNAEPAEFFGIAAGSVDGLFARQEGLRQNAASHPETTTTAGPGAPVPSGLSRRHPRPAHDRGNSAAYYLPNFHEKRNHSRTSRARAPAPCTSPRTPPTVTKHQRVTWARVRPV